MRDLKFRAWDGQEFTVFDDLYFFEENGIREVKDFIGVGHDQVFRIDQYTNLHDSSGAEIFENDIVRCTYRDALSLSDDDISEMIIKAEINCESFVGTHGGGETYEDVLIKLEIIGNTHQNPELLK